MTVLKGGEVKTGEAERMQGERAARERQRECNRRPMSACTPDTLTKTRIEPAKMGSLRGMMWAARTRTCTGNWWCSEVRPLLAKSVFKPRSGLLFTGCVGQTVYRAARCPMQ